MSRIWTRLCVAAALALCGTSASAQGFDVAGGYADAPVRGEFDWQNYQGFWFGGSAYVRPQMAIVGQFDRVVWSRTFSPVISGTHREYGYLGGIKFTSQRQRAASGFVEALAGVAQGHTTLRVGSATELSGSMFAIQGGGGGDVRLTPALSIRMVGEIRIRGPQHSFGWQFPEWRILVGVAYGFQH
jgi:hypothetical protein